jgi:hypothetical protein
MIKPYLNASHIASITADYLNTNSLKSEIGVDCVKKSELVHHHFIDLKSDIDIEYTYQSGRLDDAAYQSARARYESDYHTYQVAMTQWHAADEAAKRANNPKNPHAFGTMGTHAPRPHAPIEPVQSDYIRWGDYYTETITHQNRVTKPVQPERLPRIKDKPFESYAEIKHFVPAALAEQEGFTFTKVDSALVKGVASSVHDAAASAAVTKALEDYYHRNVTYKISHDRSTYADLIAPIWDVTFEDDSKLKKMYIDEINGVIDGEKIDESKIWTAIFGKHAAVLVALCAALMQVMGGFLAFICAGALQWAAFYGLYLYYKTSRDPSDSIAKFLDFFYIRELANQADAKTQHQLGQYLIGLEDYEQLIAYQKQREAALSLRSTSTSFIALPR